MTRNGSHEIVVIGGGPAGVTSALRARELGAAVALVERGNMGGTCTNDGCVPTRVLAHAARLVRDAGQFSDYGLEGEAPRVDFARLLNRTQRIVYEVQEKKQLRGRLEAAGVSVFDHAGDARFVDRLFYRKRYDAAKTLGAFSAKLRDGTNLDELSDDLVAIVRETVQPERVSLWLRRANNGGNGSG